MGGFSQGKGWREPNDHLIYFLGFLQSQPWLECHLKVFQKNDYLQLFPQLIFLAQNSHLLILSKDLRICRAFISLMMQTFFAQ